MPKTIMYAQHRKVVLKMTIEIVVTFCKAYFDGDKPADRVNDILICAAIMVGQAEGHPLNTSKIADLVAMARPTVIRRLAVLEKKGVVVRAGRTFKLCHEVVNSDRVVQAGMVARQAIFTACAELSKLDSKPVARGRTADL